MLWFLILLVVLWIAVCIVIATSLLILVTRKPRRELGPQGYQGTGATGATGAQGFQGVGVQGLPGERGFQGSSNAGVSSAVTNVTFGVGDGVTFSDGSTSQAFPGSRLVVDKLLTLQFSHVLVRLSTAGASGLALNVTLPDGYEMPVNTPPVSWIGFANNMNQANSTPSPVYLFDVLVTSTKTLQLRYNAVTGSLSIGNVVFLWCDFNLTIQIM